MEIQDEFSVLCDDFYSKKTLGKIGKNSLRVGIHIICSACTSQIDAYTGAMQMKSLLPILSAGEEAILKLSFIYSLV